MRAPKISRDNSRDYEAQARKYPSEFFLRYARLCKKKMDGPPMLLVCGSSFFFDNGMFGDTAYMHLVYVD